MQLMLLMGCIMLATTPLMFYYASFEDLKNYPSYYFNRFSMGNMGGSDALCQSSTIGSSVALSCSSGVISIDAIAANTDKPLYDTGIIPSTSSMKTYCTNSMMEDEFKCSDYLNKEKIAQQLQEDCVGQKQCVLSDLSQYVDQSMAGFNEGQCLGEDSFFFIQVACVIPPEDFASRQKFGLFIGSTAVFVGLFVLNYIDYIKKTQENNYVEWDVKTITASDYTIEFNLDPEFFKDYLEKEHDKFIAKMKREKNRDYLSRIQAF